MKNIFKKQNIIDTATILVVILLVIMGAVFYLRQPTTETTTMRVTIEVSDPVQVSAVTGVAASEQTVYLNSIDVPVTATAALQGPSLQIAVTGAGHIDADGLYYFNGQRLLVGQKAEIHGSYFAQGKIISIENAK